MRVLAYQGVRNIGRASEPAIDPPPYTQRRASVCSAPLARDITWRLVLQRQITQSEEPALGVGAFGALVALLGGHQPGQQIVLGPHPLGGPAQITGYIPGKMAFRTLFSAHLRKIDAATTLFKSGVPVASFSTSIPAIMVIELEGLTFPGM